VRVTNPSRSRPFFNEPRSPAYGPVNNEAARLWASKLATLDGLIIVTPEYNHSPSAVLKNALDYAYKEFNRKPIGFVGYGGVGAARAVELQMAPVAHAVHVGMLECIGIMQQGKTFEDFPHLAQAAKRLLDEMSWWAKVLKLAREGITTGVAA
jgi:NAD(P)H-dependent FMN reductase